MPILDILKCEECSATFTIERDAPGVACSNCQARYKIDRQPETRIALAMSRLEGPPDE